MNTIFDNKKTLQGIIIAVAVCLCVFFLAQASSAIKEESKNDMPATITVTGDGEFFAVPDTATFTFSVEKEGKTQKEANDAGATIMNKIIDTLKKDYGMSSTKDLKTISMSVNPKYEYSVPKPCYGEICPAYMPVSQQKIVGYTFSQTVTAKINNLDKAGEIAAKLSELGATNVNGPEFTLKDEDVAKETARKDAITNAQEKAKILADQLGVRLGKIQNFSENSGGGMYPVAYGGDMMRSATMEKSVAPEMPTGENKYTSNVSITYKIK